MRKWIKSAGLVISLLLILCSIADAQTRQSLEAKRKKLIAEIRTTTRMLQKTSKSKAAALQRYTTLQTQINQRRELIRTIEAEIAYAGRQIDRNKEVIAALQADIDRLKTEYSEMVRSAYRQRLRHNELLFIFSAQDFNEIMRRWRYLQQYQRYRQRQANLITGTQQALSRKIVLVSQQQKEKRTFLVAEQTQRKVLEKELIRKNQILKELRNNEKRLRSELDEKQRAHQQMNDAIENIITKEMLLQRRRARQPEILNNPETAADNHTSSLAFKENRGQLMWPVENGVIIKRFGRQQHPTLPNVMITNNGIDIRTEPGSEVRAVFAGVVAGKQFVPGYQNMLIIRHGDYYTVYSNLDILYVDKGDTIKFNQKIGVTAVHQQSNISELHFEVWRDKVRLNPADWLRKK